MSSQQSVVAVYKLFREDSTPAILTINRIPEANIRSSYTSHSFLGPIYDFLLSHCQQRLIYYVSEIVPVVATAEIAGWLQIEEGTPLVSFEETGFNEENRPVLTATSYFRDDLLRLKLIRRQPG